MVPSVFVGCGCLECVRVSSHVEISNEHILRTSDAFPELSNVYLSFEVEVDTVFGVTHDGFCG